MKRASEWKQMLANRPPSGSVERIAGRGGAPTLKARGIYLHSRYNPQEEAQRLVDSAAIDPQRPVFVVGVGMGYHVQELLARGVETAACDPDPDVVRFALDGPLVSTDMLMAIGDPSEWATTDAFQSYAARMPQVLVHPPTARLHPDWTEAACAALASAALSAQRLNVAVVGPLYGGSLPIAGYLAKAFRRLGHQTLLVDNSAAWDLYKGVTGSIQSKRASNQLGNLLTGFLEEWSYARVAEFHPEICIVLAQAPVGRDFPARLAAHGIVTAFWYVENWRHLPYWKDTAPCYDAFFHIQPGEFEQRLEEAGCRHHAFVQTACDPHVHRPVTLSPNEAEEYECDLSFAGAGYYNRIQFFKGLTDYAFKIWGVNWGDRDVARLVVGGERRFDNEEFMKIVAGSKINLNLHSSNAHDGVDPKCDAINPRVFEIAAAGGFQLCDPCVGLERFFDYETELPVYRDLRELRAHIDHFLAHPEERRAIAERARVRTLRDHTYENRARQMLEFLIARHGARILRRGVRIQRSIAEAAARAAEHPELAGWLATLPPDAPFTPESINELLQPATRDCYPERVFAYMKEVRDFAESLMKERT